MRWLYQAQPLSEGAMGGEWLNISKPTLTYGIVGRNRDAVVRIYGEGEASEWSTGGLAVAPVSFPIYDSRNSSRRDAHEGYSAVL